MRALPLIFLFVCAVFAQECDYTCDNCCEFSGEVSESVDLSNGLTFVFDIDSEITAVGRWIRFQGSNNIIKMKATGGSGVGRKLIFGTSSCPVEGTTVITSSEFRSLADTAEVKFFLEPLHSVYIFIGAEIQEGSQPSGSVTFTTTDVEPDPHSFCSSPEEITSLPFEFDDSLENVIASPVPCHLEPTQGHWYHFKGTGKHILASTCSDDNTVETSIDVYSSCEPDTLCIDTDSRSCPTGGSILFQTGQDIDYYLFVGSASGATGQFHLSVTERDVSCTNFECENPKNIATVPFKDTASTRLCPDTASTCIENNMHGVWYQFEAPESGKYLIDTCNSSAGESADTIIELHEGCGAAPEGKCIEYSDNFCGRRSAITAELERDHSYQVYVTGFNSHLEGVDYTLSVQKIPKDRVNDECLFASEISDFPISVTGNTKDMRGATTTFSCINEEPAPRHGAWFRYYSTGKYILNFSTCSENNKLKGDIEVYRNCQNICVGIGSYTKENGCSYVLVPTEHDDILSIFVSPVTESEDEFFNLTITEYPSTIYASCPTARDVQKSELPFRHKDSTYGGSDSWSSCSTMVASSMWFHFKGTGKTMIATTCGDATAVATVLELYDGCPEEGSTDHCLKKNIDYEGCPTRSLIEFDSVEGKDYYLLARGNVDQEGVIEVRIYEATVPINSKCDTAVPMTLGNKSNGIIQFAAISGGSCSPGVDRRGGWFKFQGTGKYMVADTCNDGTNFDSDIEIYKSCDTETGKGSSCYARSTSGTCYSGSSISFNTEKGKTYYAYVSAPAYGPSVDNSYFLLDLREVKGESSSGKKGSGLGPVAIVLIVLVCILGAALVAFAVFYIVQRQKNNVPGATSYQSAEDVDAVPASSNTSAQENVLDEAELESPAESKRDGSSAVL